MLSCTKNIENKESNSQATFKINYVTYHLLQFCVFIILVIVIVLVLVVFELVVEQGFTTLSNLLITR